MINNPLQWTFIAAVFHYTPQSEESLEASEQIISDVLECNNSENTYVWTSEEAKKHCVVGGRFYTKGTCDHCGAAFNYGAIYHHKVNNEHIVIGNICATNHMQLSSHQVLDKKMRIAAKAAKTKAANQVRLNALDEPFKSAITHTHYISQDIKSKWLQYGSISEAQTALLYRILEQDQDQEKAAQPTYKGTIGCAKERLTFTDVVCIKSGGYKRDSYSGYGSEWVSITTLLTSDNKLLVVKTPSWSAEKGEKLTIKATVKCHEVYEGNDQTLIQRVKTLETSLSGITLHTSS